jgi:tetratricopeptide (TPR) repeat protein
VENIEKFFEALEEQGLYKGRIIYNGNKYIFPKGRRSPQSNKDDALELGKPPGVKQKFDFFVSFWNTLVKERNVKRIYIYGFMVAIVLILIIVSIPNLTESKNNAQNGQSNIEYIRFINLARKQLEEKKFENARASALEAKKRKDTPYVNKLLKDIEDKKEASYQELFKLAETYLESKKFQAALDAAKKAKDTDDTQEIRKLIKDIETGKKIYDNYLNLLNSAQKQLEDGNFKAALEEAMKAKNIENTKEVVLLIEKIENAEKESFDNFFNLINTVYQQGDFDKAREHLEKAGEMKFNDKLEEELKKLGIKINPLPVDISENFPSIKSITFEPVAPNDFSIIGISERIPYTKINESENLNAISTDMLNWLRKKGIPLLVFALPSGYFNSEKYTKLWNEKLDSGKWQICTQGNKYETPILLKKTGINFEEPEKKEFLEENLNEYRDQIFVRFVLIEGGKHDKE